MATINISDAKLGMFLSEGVFISDVQHYGENTTELTFSSASGVLGHLMTARDGSGVIEVIDTVEPVIEYVRARSLREGFIVAREGVVSVVIRVEYITSSRYRVDLIDGNGYISCSNLTGDVQFQLLDWTPADWNSFRHL